MLYEDKDFSNCGMNDDGEFTILGSTQMPKAKSSERSDRGLRQRQLGVSWPTAYVSSIGPVRTLGVSFTKIVHFGNVAVTT
jgi:hypothetical protein